MGRGWSVLAGIGNITLIAHFLSASQQGFYYTFNNILALQVFFELGLTIVIEQYASHEMARLKWNSSGLLEGDSVSLARVYSLLRFSSVWYGVAAVLILLFVWPSGWWFFSAHAQSGVDVAWQLAWSWLVVVAALNLFISPVISLLGGCQQVTEIARMRMGQAVCCTLALWFTLLLHGGLLAVPVFSTMMLVWNVGWLFRRYHRFLAGYFCFADAGIRISWSAEIWPFQWRIAVSWLCGYFLFQLFTPVLFAYQGAVVAGQMGMSLAIVSALSNVMAAWVHTKAPTFGSLIASRHYQELDNLFHRCLRQSLALLIAGSIAVWLLVYGLNLLEIPLHNRLLEPLPFALLLLTTIVNHVISTQAAYLRAHKQEPMMPLSIFMGLTIGLSTYFLGRCGSVLGMMAGYFLITATVGLGWSSWLLRQKRKQWHKDGVLHVG